MLPKSLILVTALAACAQFPALEGRVSAVDRAAPFPILVPLGPLIALAGGDAGTMPAAAGLEGRIAALNARAAALRGDIIDPATRARMQAGVRSGALQ